MDFSKYSNNYSETVQQAIHFSGESHSFFVEVKAQSLVSLATTHFPNPKELDVLDIGCGIGLTDSYLTNSFKSLTGIDVDCSSIQKAKETNEGINYLVYDGKHLPFAEKFNLAFTICVMHHVPPQDWLNFLKESYRVLKPKGMMAVFEHNPLNPLTRKVVKDCPLDEDAVLLKASTTKKLLREAGYKNVQTNYLLLFPFRNNIFRLLEAKLPIGAQYVCYGFKD